MTQVKNVLLIDDDEINNMVCSKIIQKNNFASHVVTSLGGRQALAYLRQAITDATPLPDVIFLDINMPVMNGWDFLDQFGQIPELQDQNILLIMLSSSSSSEDIDRAANYPQVAQYITKPLTAAHLAQIKQTFFPPPDSE